ncbi:hypothetical protein SLS56_006800 [Neofusicoccum ribis]|uniref:Major facilitator superfamily transporter n=1 Tax=Neofusicoccum ribis TaxID=45134 RepID=A0ABR3SPU2_9PEZI
MAPPHENVQKEPLDADVEMIENAKDTSGPELPPLLQGLAEDEIKTVEKKMIRKVDWRMLPLIILMYILVRAAIPLSVSAVSSQSQNYLDRNNIAAARLAGLEDDLHLTGSQYQTAVSILFVGYVLMQGCMFYLSSWYTRKELGGRMAILFMGSLLSGAFSGLIAAGILDGMAGVMGLPSWRWLFILEGVATVVVAIVAVFCLPNLPNTTSWLSEQERQLALWRLEQDIGEDDQAQSEDESLLRGFKLALTDVKVYVVALILTCIASSASVLNFFPTVVETLGYGSTETLLLTAPPYILCMITAYLVSWSSDRAGERYFYVTAPLYVAIVAFILAASTTATTPRYIAMVLMIPGFWSSWSLVFAWTSSSIPRPASKRAAALAMVNAVANSANIFGSFMYPKSQAPRYGRLGLLAPRVEARVKRLMSAGSYRDVGEYGYRVGCDRGGDGAALYSGATE